MTDDKALTDAVRLLIRHAGADPDSPEYAETPRRYLDALREMTGGTGVNVPSLFKTFEAYAGGQTVVVKNVAVRSVCKHHLLPFWGVAHVAYRPEGAVIGLSKIARLVDALSRRLQIQETLTYGVADWINRMTHAEAACMVEATHSCMCARGVRSDGKMVTTYFTEGFRESRSLREEFYASVRQD